MTILKQSNTLPKAYNLDGESRRATWDKIYQGTVKNNNDVTGQRRIQVFIPELCGEDNENTWILVDSASTFYGVSAPNGQGNGSTTHGSTFPHQIGSQVLIGFVNGDPNRGFVFAALPQPATGETLTPSDPGYVITANPNKSALPGTPSPAVPASQNAAQISGNITLPVSQGGPTTRNMANSLSPMGITTPGGHTIVLDDDGGDGYVRIQTRYGTQILLHDITDTIILQTGNGRGKITMHSNGNLDIYTANHYSVRADGDINLNSGNNINISGKNINIDATKSVNILSTSDLHVNAQSNMFLTANGEMHRVANGSIFDVSTRKTIRYANLGISDTAAAGSIEVISQNGNIHQSAISGTIDLYSTGNMHLYTGGTFDLLSIGNIHQSSNGTFDLSSSGNMHQSTKGTLDISSTGIFKISTSSTFNVKSTGDIIEQTDGTLHMTSANDTRIKSGANFDVLSAKSVKITSGSDANIGGTVVNIQGTSGDINLQAGGAVKLGPATVLNASGLPNASKADSASSTTSAVAADPATIGTIATPATIGGVPPGVTAITTPRNQHAITTLL